MRNLSHLDPFRVPYLGAMGDAGNGLFELLVKGNVLKVLASDGGGWEHVSVSLSDRCPTWDEMCIVKDLFFDESECVVQYHPPRSEYVNYHPFCLHLWKPTEFDMILPPSILVGPKTLEPAR